MMTPALGLVVSATALGAVAFRPFAVGGAQLEPGVLAMVAVALTVGPATGATAGFVAGLLFDLDPAAVHPTGATALALSIAGYLVGWVGQRVRRPGRPTTGGRRGGRVRRLRGRWGSAIAVPALAACGCVLAAAIGTAVVGVLAAGGDTGGGITGAVGVPMTAGPGGGLGLLGTAAVTAAVAPIAVPGLIRLLPTTGGEPEGAWNGGT